MLLKEQFLQTHLIFFITCKRVFPLFLLVPMSSWVLDKFNKTEKLTKLLLLCPYPTWNKKCNAFEYYWIKGSQADRFYECNEFTQTRRSWVKPSKWGKRTTGYCSEFIRNPLYLSLCVPDLYGFGGVFLSCISYSDIAQPVINDLLTGSPEAYFSSVALP